MKRSYGIVAHETFCSCEQSIRVVVGQGRQSLYGVFSALVHLIWTDVHGVRADAVYKQSVFFKPADVQLRPSASFVVDFQTIEHLLSSHLL